MLGLEDRFAEHRLGGTLLHRRLFVLLFGLLAAWPTLGASISLTGEVRITGGEPLAEARVHLAFMPSNHARLEGLLAGQAEPQPMVSGRSAADVDAMRMTLRTDLRASLRSLDGRAKAAVAAATSAGGGHRRLHGQVG